MRLYLKPEIMEVSTSMRLYLWMDLPMVLQVPVVLRAVLQTPMVKDPEVVQVLWDRVVPMEELEKEKHFRFFMGMVVLVSLIGGSGGRGLSPVGGGGAGAFGLEANGTGDITIGTTGVLSARGGGSAAGAGSGGAIYLKGDVITNNGVIRATGGVSTKHPHEWWWRPCCHAHGKSCHFWHH